MLDGRFLEGVALSDTKTSAKPYLLPLPDDDAQAVTLLCKLLHFDIADIPDRPSPQSLEYLAFACDKYNCLLTLQYCGSIWVRNWLDHYRLKATEPPRACAMYFEAFPINLPISKPQICRSTYSTLVRIC